MKRILLTISLALVLMSAMAQTKMTMKDMFPAGTTFKTGDGKIIPAEKLQSAINAMGGKFNIKHVTGEPKVVYLVVPDAKADKEAEASRRYFDAMLGRAAPYFTLADINGKRYDLKTLKGKVVVLNFWFIRCPVCVTEMPKLNKIRAKYKTDQVVFLALGLDNNDQIRNFLKSHPFHYTLLPDADAVFEAYGVDACPVSMVIDRKGVLRFVMEGSQDVETVLPKAIDTAVKTAAR